MIHNYPYTDFNEYNLDWVITRIKELTEQWAAYKAQMDSDWSAVRAEWTTMKADLEELKAFITNYFDNLDVQEEINNKIDEMAADGSLLNVIRSTVVSQTTTATEAWLTENVHPETGYVIDDTLTISGAAADAKVTGSRINDIKNGFETETKTEIISFESGYYINNVGETVDITEHITSSGTKCAVVDCAEGDIFTLNGTGGGGSNRVLWAFIDSSGNNIRKAKNSEIAKDEVIIAPADADKLIINLESGSVNTSCFKGIIVDQKLNQINADIKTLIADNSFKIQNDFVQGLISTNGTIDYNTKYCYTRFFYPVHDITDLSYSIDTDYLLSVRFYAADGKTITGTASGASSADVHVSKNSKYVRFNISKADNSSITPSDAAELDISIVTNNPKNNMIHDTVLRDFSLTDSYVTTGYLNEYGGVVENANHKTTGFIPVKAGDEFDYSLVSGGKAFVVWDLNLNVVDSVGVGTISTVNEGTYTVLSDGYIKFSNRTASYSGAYVRFNKTASDIMKYELAAIEAMISDSQNHIESYFVNEMEDTITKVLALKTEPCIVFPIITDIHYRYPGTNPLSFDHSVQNIKHFLNKVKCNFVLNLGDSSDGRAALETQIEYSNYQAERFAGIDVPYYMVQGNHELNIYRSETYDGSDKLTNEQIYTLFFNKTPLDVVYNPDCFMDYYMDFPMDVRLVVLNFSNQSAYKIGADTLSWFRDTALDTDKTILLATHYSPIPEHNSYSESYTDANFASMTSVINTFIGNGGKIIHIYGHSHSDFKFTSPWLQVSLNNARPLQSNISDLDAYGTLISALTSAGETIDSPARSYGTATEDCWTVCVLRPLSGKVDFIRFGAGSDRTGLTF